MSTTYVLTSYQQNFDDPASIDVVRTTVRIYDNGTPVGGRDLALSNAQLTAHAEEQGRKTWDERDVALMLAGALGSTVYISEPTPIQPTPTQAEPAPIVLSIPQPTRAPWWKRWFRRSR